jgi:hydrogenase maturation protein HypF
MSIALHRPQAIKVTLSGHVQGVGFRPFVYRLASHYGITGQVQNRMGDVEVVACGDYAVLQQFCDDVVECAPPLSRITATQRQWLPDALFDSFNIVASAATASPQVAVPPDYFMCDECRAELQDPGDRRYHYPFINCTQCGPRYTLIQSLPYDRPNTSMSEFPMCPDCQAEYTNPHDRRFHAEPIACAACGPQLSFVADDASLPDDPMAAAVRMLQAGKTIAVKGIGGYHLICDALNPAAVARLRDRKRRPDKPLAVMFPVGGADGCDEIRRYAQVSDVDASLIAGPMRPIVLLRNSGVATLAANIAPGLEDVGVFLPYSPLHQLLLDAIGQPLVATSGNISGEPVLTDNEQARQHLAPLVDGFLHHDRRIVRPADDSVFRNVAGQPRPLRLGRGAAPFEFDLPWQQACPTLAVGGQMKSTIALAWQQRVVMSPHIGEMDSPRSLAVFEQLVEDLQALYRVRIERIVCDAHPGYTTHRWSHQQENVAVETVWHHHAHASALAAEFRLRDPALVFTWDGVGLGEDGDLWGGEALLGRAGCWRRVGSLRRFRLPGGDKAGRQPWRSAAALAWACDQSWPACPDADGLANTAWRRGINCPSSTAAGRLFDAAAAFILGVHNVSFEAAGPMQLEALCRSRRDPISLPVENADGIWRIDWAPLLDLLLDDHRDSRERAEIFHSSLAHAVHTQAQIIRDETDVEQVGLCGGVFQNRALSEQVIELLRADGFQVFLPTRLPCNDAALCIGQAAEIAAREMTRST